uniref:Zinc finger BED domain-containing protein RICESLEEPER 1-like n=1 Tax=Elaeis guineensis var. tenera TaxID=51953 RepID=A0A6J0PLN7_ELAGV|nr:zinc finger BED domain-containing protein RICESLEEPER 1-like [Elaeis guineensis]
MDSGAARDCVVKEVSSSAVSAPMASTKDKSKSEAACIYCNVIIKCTSKSGTSGMHSHIERYCKKNLETKDKRQRTLAFINEPLNLEEGSNSGSPSLLAWQFDQKTGRRYLARMIILDEMLFKTVEHRGFRDFLNVLQPKFKISSWFTIVNDILELYISERDKLKSYLKRSAQRVCLTIDIWTSRQNLSYMCLIGHFIDVIGKPVERLLLEWGINKVLTLAVDNASSNDLRIMYLKEMINSWKGSLAVLNVDTRWNSTFLMLQSAVPFQQAFERLKEKDSRYRAEMTDDKHWGLPTDEDWDNTHNLLPFLKYFYDATLRASGSHYVTTNDYFHMVYGIGIKINSHISSEDSSFKEMAIRMKKEHDKYWANVTKINPLLFVALVLDPRYKLEYVNFAIDEIYEEPKNKELRARVREVLDSLFAYYSDVDGKNDDSSKGSAFLQSY